MAGRWGGMVEGAAKEEERRRLVVDSECSLGRCCVGAVAVERVGDVAGVAGAATAVLPHLMSDLPILGLYSTRSSWRIKAEMLKSRGLDGTAFGRQNTSSPSPHG